MDFSVPDGSAAFEIADIPDLYSLTTSRASSAISKGHTAADRATSYVIVKDSHDVKNSARNRLIMVKDAQPVRFRDQKMWK
mmetsp:Transcript_10449/g.15962  ORF Transcript_10449/g.15962 Transcript_10449/m.15962 type:complete len:81 (-) Transcript_10449:9-251(-)